MRIFNFDITSEFTNGGTNYIAADDSEIGPAEDDEGSVVPLYDKLCRENSDLIPTKNSFDFEEKINQLQLRHHLFHSYQSTASK